MAGATASTSPTQPGSTGSAAKAGAMGSSGGTTTGTVACSSCCAPQGRYLTALFGGYGEVGQCPGAIDNSQKFPVYFTFVLSMIPPYTASGFSLPSSFTLTGTAGGFNFFWDEYSYATIPGVYPCPSPPSSPFTPVDVSNSNKVPGFEENIFLFFPYPSLGTVTVWGGPTFCPSLIRSKSYARNFLTVSCSPPVFTFEIDLVTSVFWDLVGTAQITVTF
ncbi:hypothetical protein UFOVP829_17 [uncultured Caudovirales phage]|uniref:Uncharacterized protein n=1 Tax=uncultured Caudovirales phage TaxID=2100421 RepID=A0A6J5MLJ3_9CAUD|nr:hypothetical protein UFOVP493_49 [uncultured Caudovirales phage]CAB4164244.1 hypothetical protein UFOVP829_17 [uncultured Caudovirales phage]CAB4177692.1 hypothetical protein UFOVP1003_33 [uncultured Caudovirales phage]CAB4187699.1 hypothetical protein UFOVP1153_49 [uncultured Caudovirales phage]